MPAKSPPIKSRAVRGSQGCNFSVYANSKTKKKRQKANMKFNEQTIDAECIYDEN